MVLIFAWHLFFVILIIHRALPSQHRKQKKVDQVEKELLCHPLALYPHIEDSVPPDVRVNPFVVQFF